MAIRDFDTLVRPTRNFLRGVNERHGFTSLKRNVSHFNLSVVGIIYTHLKCLDETFGN